MPVPNNTILLQKTATFNGEENGQTVMIDVYITGRHNMSVKRDYIRKGSYDGVIHLSVDIDMDEDEKTSDGPLH